MKFTIVDQKSELPDAFIHERTEELYITDGTDAVSFGYNGVVTHRSHAEFVIEWDKGGHTSLTGKSVNLEF